MENNGKGNHNSLNNKRYEIKFYFTNFIRYDSIYNGMHQRGKA